MWLRLYADGIQFGRDDEMPVEVFRRVVNQAAAINTQQSKHKNQDREKQRQ